VCPRHQFVGTATSVNNGACVPIKTVKTLIPRWFGANDPDNHVIGAITGSNKGRATTSQGRTPAINNSRWIGRTKPESSQQTTVGVEDDQGALRSRIGDRRIYDPVVGNVSSCYRRGDTPQVIAIKHIGIATFAHRHYKMRRRRSWHVYE
jgi:hypothetical protein